MWGNRPIPRWFTYFFFSPRTTKFDWHLPNFLWYIERRPTASCRAARHRRLYGRSHEGECWTVDCNYMMQMLINYPDRCTFVMSRSICVRCLFSFFFSPIVFAILRDSTDGSKYIYIIYIYIYIYIWADKISILYIFSFPASWNTVASPVSLSKIQTSVETPGKLSETLKIESKKSVPFSIRVTRDYTFQCQSDGGRSMWRSSQIERSCDPWH